MSIAEKLTIIAENEQKVYEAGCDKGRTDEWSDFWDVYQQKGTRSTYYYAFCNAYWDDKTFKPKYNLAPRYQANAMFQYSTITDLVAILEKQGVVLDVSRASTVTAIFASCTKLTRVPEINASGVTSSGNANQMFLGCGALETIEKLVFSQTVGITYSSAFSSCTSLKNVVFEGRVTRSIDFSWSPLTPASMKSLIACLEDYSTASTGVYTVTFNDDCWTALEADSSAPDGGTWREYVEYKLGWNT